MSTTQSAREQSTIYRQLKSATMIGRDLLPRLHAAKAEAGRLLAGIGDRPDGLRQNLLAHLKRVHSALATAELVVADTDWMTLDNSKKAE